MTPGYIEIDFPRFYCPRGSRVSTLVMDPLDLAFGPDMGYTRYSKSQSFRLVALTRKHPLHPLTVGRSVQLFMELPQAVSAVKRAAVRKPTPVVVVPGPLFGSADGMFLVAVIGKGSAVIAPGNAGNVSRLVGAGMPARLANTLVREIRNLVWSQHATRQSSPRRRSSGSNRPPGPAPGTP